MMLPMIKCRLMVVLDRPKNQVGATVFLDCLFPAIPQIGSYIDEQPWSDSRVKEVYYCPGVDIVLLLLKQGCENDADFVGWLEFAIDKHGYRLLRHDQSYTELWREIPQTDKIDTVLELLYIRSSRRAKAKTESL